LSPSSPHCATCILTNGRAPTSYTIEKHALSCLFLDGQVLPIGRYARPEEALAAAICHMKSNEEVRCPLRPAVWPSKAIKN
jgi:hypothetical protein